MFFEVAGIEVHPIIPPLVALLISTFTSTGGVSGAFLLLPFQVSVLGFTSPSVSSTNQLYNIVATPSGVYKYIKEGRMVWPLTWIVVIGTLPGVFLGALIRINLLSDPTIFKIFAGFVLLYIGIRLIKDVISKKNNNNNSETRFQELVKKFSSHQNNEKIKLPRSSVKKFNLKELVYEFYGESYTVPTLSMFIISFIVGIAGGAYGIGGGAIIAPIYIAFYKLPVYTVAGPALMGTFITSVAGVIFYQLLSPYYPNLTIAPDWLLGFLFGIGGLVGMYIGASIQKYIPARIIKWILGFCILFLAINYILIIFK
ncbi:MAG TPA: sulfite exporter TauE/SafE family protein [Candidatus Kapabacteria bacterium]|nr:sulfite exporter TauE/SafE family protein [Candidatus Kapabacteria bacterium]